MPQVRRWPCTWSSADDAGCVSIEVRNPDRYFGPRAFARPPVGKVYLAASVPVQSEYRALTLIAIGDFVHLTIYPFSSPGGDQDPEVSH